MSSKPMPGKAALVCGAGGFIGHHLVKRLKREVAEKWSIPLVNPAHELQSGGKDFYLEADPVHLNYRGNQIIARALFDTVARFSN